MDVFVSGGHVQNNNMCQGLLKIVLYLYTYTQKGKKKIFILVEDEEGFK